MSRALILVDPHPRALSDILDAATRSRLEALGDLVIHEGSPMPAQLIDRHIAEAALLIGQTDLPTMRLQRAKNLRAVINVETNFLPNIDYDACFNRGIHVITPGAAFAGVVAEAALGMAIDLARGITSADRSFRKGREQYGLAGNRAFFAYAVNYLVDLDHAIIVDVEASRAIRQAEVGAARTMIERTEDRFGLYPARLAADSAYGSAAMLDLHVPSQDSAPAAYGTGDERLRQGMHATD